MFKNNIYIESLCTTSSVISGEKKDYRLKYSRKLKFFNSLYPRFHQYWQSMKFSWTYFWTPWQHEKTKVFWCFQGLQKDDCKIPYSVQILMNAGIYQDVEKDVRGKVTKLVEQLVKLIFWEISEMLKFRMNIKFLFYWLKEMKRLNFQ